MYLDFYGNDKGAIGSNLITSGKSVTTLEKPKNPEVKLAIKPEQETVSKNKNGEISKTSRFTIHYDSKDNAHVVPAAPTKIKY